MKKNEGSIKGHKKRIAPVLLAFALTTGIGSCAMSNSSSDNDEKKYYLIDLDDLNEFNMPLLDKDGNEINIIFDNMSDVVAIVDQNEFQSDKTYAVTLVSSKDVRVQSGYVEGKYLDETILQSIPPTETTFDEINVVSPKFGAWLRKEIDSSKNTDDAILLEQGTYVLASTDSIESPDNDSCREVFWYNGDKIELGYMKDKDLINGDFHKAKGMRMTVNTQSPLKMRAEASTSSEEIAKLEPGTEVIVVPNVPLKNAEGYDWYYIATKEDDKYKFGFSAGTYYQKDKPVNYLKKKLDSVLKVNTEKDGRIPLNLRSGPSKDSKILGRISNGSIVYTTQDAINGATDSDGHEWIEVTSYSNDNGYNNGYVATEYLERCVINRVNTKKDNGMDLSLRSGPSTDEECLAKIPNGSIVYATQDEINNVIDSNGHKWLKVTLDEEFDGHKYGYVARDYLEEYHTEQLEQPDEQNYQPEQNSQSVTTTTNTNDKDELNFKPITTTIPGNDGEGNLTGFLAIDCHVDSITDFDLGNILKNGIVLNDCYGLDNNITQKPCAVMIKLGATGYGNKNGFKIAQDVNGNNRDDYYAKVNKLARKCEEMKTPYGFYYFSQAITKEEIDCEIAYIMEYYQKYKKTPYNILPTAWDVEDVDNGRATAYAKDNKEAYTTLINDGMNTLRGKLEEYGVDVILYSCNNAFENMLNYSDLENSNKKNIWCVETGRTHTNNLRQSHNETVNNTAMRQTAVDKKLKGAEGNTRYNLDIDLIDPVYFKNLLETELGYNLDVYDEEPNKNEKDLSDDLSR